MQTSATNSSLEVAAWILNKARNEGQVLEHEKLQHLLFLAQFHYLSTHPDILLMPSLFVHSHSICFEPNIAKLHTSGLLADFPIRFDNEICDFLNKIWRIYGPLSLRQLNSVVKEHLSRLEFSNQQNSILDFQTLVEKFKTHNKISNKDTMVENKKISSHPWSSKIMLSQNGPVVVSKWKPRKLSDKVSLSTKI